MPRQENESWGMVFIILFVMLAMGSVIQFISAAPELDNLLLERTVKLMVLGTIVFVIGKFVTDQDL